MDEFLLEAKRLYDLDFAVHWLKPHSKAPVKNGWSKNPLEKWNVLKAEYRKGLGLGVRLGKLSQLKDETFLANIDVDVKSGDPFDREQALKELERLFPGVRGTTAEVKTGTGLRLFVRTREPLPSRKLAQSKDFRDGQKHSWEIELMSEGRQVVLPPTIHPDTKRPYVWKIPIHSIEDIRLIEVSGDKRRPGRPEGSHVFDFEIEDVDMITMPEDVYSLLNDAAADRSKQMFHVCLAMLRHRYTDNQILSLLTDPNFEVGRMSFEHANTKSRKRAAAWVKRYTLTKAKENFSAKAVFDDAVDIEDNEPVRLSAEDAAKQMEEIKESQFTLERKTNRDGTPGKPLPTLGNVLYILEKEIHPQLIKRDLFKVRDVYGVDTPWGAKKDQMLEDEDALIIKEWILRRYNFEPSRNTIEEAIVIRSRKNSFHPIKEMLESLPPWDGVDRLNTGLKKYLDAEGDPEYLAQVFRKWMVAAVSRVYQPGTKFDWIIILEGMQGRGKSRFGELLFGSEYFTDWLPKDLSDKEAMVTLEGNWCIEFGELAVLNKTELRDVKNFIPRSFDKFRRPFATRKVELGRQCVFFGTTNEDQYLQDETGNRRFMPVKVGKLNEPELLTDRLQLWAETLLIYQLGLEPMLYLNEKAQEMALNAQEEKRIISETDIMVRDILDYIEEHGKKPNNERFNFSLFRLKDLFQGGGPLEIWDWRLKSHQMFAGRALRKVGAKKVHRADGEFWSLDTNMPDVHPKSPRLEIIKS